PVNATLLKDVLLDLKKQGKTIMFSTHRMDQVDKLCDAMCLVDHGRPVLSGELREVKARWGRKDVQIDYDGDANFLAEAAHLIETSNDYGNYVEVRLRADANAQELLRIAVQRVRVNRFELMEPSLEQIFIETVGKSAERSVAAV